MKVLLGGVTVLFLILAFINAVIFVSDSPTVDGLTGRVLTAGVTLFIESNFLIINITSPANATYNFNVGTPYIIDLNVSSPDNIVVWRYKLEDLRHGVVINQSVPFTPNTTITAVRWINKLTVYGNNTGNATGSTSVIFNVNVPNSAPVINNLSTNLYACEATTFSAPFNVTDPDEDDLQTDISPKNPFFVEPILSVGQTHVNAQIYSGLLTKSDLGLHQEEVFSTDNVGGIDTRRVNITVIEVNNAPSIVNLSGAYTLWSTGDESNLELKVAASDIESGSNISVNFTHNLTFQGESPFFTMNRAGYANISVNASLLGVHNVTFCLTDSALSSIHPNISVCGVTGLNQTTCKNFTITVTNENRAPTIVSHIPVNLSINVSGSDITTYSVRSHDPDGTFPDNYWYVDGVLKKYVPANIISEFEHFFGCGVSGIHTIKVEVTDGVYNDSVNWSVQVAPTNCPTTPTPTGGGAGGASVFGCRPLWGCDEWNTCQNTEASLQQGFLGGDDYRVVKDGCTRNTLGVESCGFQIRNCMDVNSCNETIVNKPAEIIQCYYTSNPSCFDRIKNCHGGLCEFLVDCGGPCGACPTCSDGIQNQGEIGVDCGSPCPTQCAVRQPIVQKDSVRIILIAINLLLLIIILIIIARILFKYLRSKLDNSGR